MGLLESGKRKLKNKPTTIKEGLIEKIKSAQKEQQENNLQNGER